MSTAPEKILESAAENTFLEKEQVEALYADFCKVSDRWQMMHRMHLTNLYQRYFPDGDATNFAKHVFRTMDVNKKGKIDFKQFLQYHHLLIHGRLEEKMKWIFHVFDSDEDGLIDRNEMFTVLNDARKLRGRRQLPKDSSTRQRVDMIFRKLDRDCSGSIDLEEFVNGGKKDPSIVGFFLSQTM